MKVAEYNLYNVGPTPREIKRQRQEIFDFHRTLGTPVILKHRWNIRDAQNGLCQPCPFLDEAYHRDTTDCPYCFGTGFLGGFADGVIVFVTIADAPIDTLRISSEGYILFQKHPQLTAPWTPDMGDGDLIITAEFDRSTWEVLQTLDIYELNQTDIITIRGIWGQYTDYKLYKVQQTCKIDTIPKNHIYYNVPITFDYTNIPVVVPPIGAFPSDYPHNTVSVEKELRIIGSEGGVLTSAPQKLNITGAGTAATASRTLKINGNVGPLSSTVIFE